MKKTLITYHLILVLSLLVLIMLEIVANSGKSEHSLITIFTEFAIYISAINILISMPNWIVVLLFNKQRKYRKSLLIGLGLFLTFVGLASWSVVAVIVYMTY